MVAVARAALCPPVSGLVDVEAMRKYFEFDPVRAAHHGLECRKPASMLPRSSGPQTITGRGPLDRCHGEELFPPRRDSEISRKTHTD